MKRRTGIQTIGWGFLYIFWILVFQKRELAFAQTASVEFCYLVFIAANYYLNAYFSVPKYLYRKRYISFTVLFLTGIAIASLLRVPLAMLLNKYYFLAGQSRPGFNTIFPASFFNIFIWTLVIVSVKIIYDRFKFQQHVDEVNKQKEQAELDFLNAQLNPHFLFNSINSIYGTIDKENTSARNMLLTFSDMLRYQLYECNQKSIPIEKELVYIRNYIELQKVRKECDLTVEYYTGDGVKNFSIAPLLFIAFIENSFKYAARNSKGELSISISFKKENGNLIFTCCNSKGNQPANKIEHKGIGMTNANRRLALLYADRHILTIGETNDHFNVNLTLLCQI